MLTRRHETELVFRHPFLLPGEALPCPAGRWRVETEEELIQALSFPVWRRVATAIRLQDTRPGQTVCSYPVDPKVLAAAQAADAA